MSPRFIHFFGPDGAGKTTQVEILVKTMRKRKMRVRKCWMRSPHTLAFLLWRLFIKIGFYRVVHNPFGAKIRLPAVNRNRLLRSFWAMLEFFSVLPLIIRIRLHMMRGYHLVAERFILDTITTIAFFIDDMHFLRGRSSRLLLLFIPQDTVFIFLDSNFEAIFRRRAPLYVEAHRSKERGYGTIPETAVEPKEFINFQRAAYKTLAKTFNACVFDTTMLSVQETSEQILDCLRART